MVIVFRINFLLSGFLFRRPAGVGLRLGGFECGGFAIFAPYDGFSAATADDLHYRKFVLIFNYPDFGRTDRFLTRLGRAVKVKLKLPFDLGVAAFYNPACGLHHSFLCPFPCCSGAVID
jgi:hypothetical protein